MTREKISLKERYRRFVAYVHTPQALRLCIYLTTLVLCLGLFSAAISPVRYNLRIGMVPTHTISATKDVVDEIATQTARAQAAAAVSPTYKFQEDITEQVLGTLDQVFTQLKAVRQYAQTLPDLTSERKFTQEELDYAKTILSSITLRDYQLTTLMHADPEALDTLHQTVYAAAENTMNGNVTEGQEYQAVQSILQIIGFSTPPSLLQNVAMPVLNTCIRANMVIDLEATEAARKAAGEAVEPVVYKQGQNIVVKGEGRIKSNQLAMLSSLGLLSNDAVDTDMYLGGMLLTALVMVLWVLLMHGKDFEVSNDTVKCALTCISFVLTLGLCMLARLLNAYIAPVALCALLITTLVGMRTALVTSVTLSILAASLAAGGNEAYSEQMVLSLVVYLSTSALGVWMMHEKSSRLRALFTGLLMAALSFLIILSYGLMTSSDITGTIKIGLWCVGGSLAATLLYIAVQPLLELIFNLPTPLKLLELSNPNQPLLKKLLLEASGTYHHAIIVANLAEAAAEAIGANPLLARVGGYYHDVGKLKRPLYFRENQLNQGNGHDHTDPAVSAAIITSHVSDGITIAKNYRLPQAVIDIIAEHHGDTPVMFFYHKAVQQANGKPVDIDDFRYEGHPPTTKESAIVMLCDTIEAAVRSLKNPTPESIENFIVKLVRGKLEDGQLSNAPLTLRDIDKICSACTTVLSGVFHERIEYPDVEKKTRLHAPAAAEKESKQEEKAAAAQAPEMPEKAPIVVPQPIPDPLPVVPMENPDVPLQFTEPAVRLDPLPEVPMPPVLAPVPIDDMLSMQEFNDASAIPPADETMIPMDLDAKAPENEAAPNKVDEA